MFERLLCAVLGHRFVVERQLNPRARKVGCTRCQRKWAMHDPTQTYLPSESEFEELYAPRGLLREDGGKA